MSDKFRASLLAAEKEWQYRNGKCCMCSAGDRPVRGLHRSKHLCGNAETCLLCHNADMSEGDQCAACGRIEYEEIKP